MKYVAVVMLACFAATFIAAVAKEVSDEKCRCPESALDKAGTAFVWLAVASAVGLAAGTLLSP